MIGFHHADNGFIIAHFAHNSGNSQLADCHTSRFTSMSRKHLIPAVRHGTHDCRLAYTVFTNTLRHIQHCLVLPHLKRVVGEVAYFGDRYFLHIFRAVGNVDSAIAWLVLLIFQCQEHCGGALSEVRFLRCHTQYLPSSVLRA